MCCTPYISTIVAGILCIFQSFANLAWNLPVIISLGWNNSQVALLSPFDVSEIKLPFELFGITLVYAILNIQLLIFSCMMLKANANLKTAWIGAWCLLILIKSMFEGAVGAVYFDYYKHANPSRRQTYFKVAALFSGVFFFWPTLNLIFSIFVLKRYIDVSKSNLSGSSNQASTSPPPYAPGSFILPRANNTVDPAPVTGWSHRPLLNFDEDLLTPTPTVTSPNGNNNGNPGDLPRTELHV